MKVMECFSVSGSKQHSRAAYVIDQFNDIRYAHWGDDTFQRVVWLDTTLGELGEWARTGKLSVGWIVEVLAYKYGKSHSVECRNGCIGHKVMVEAKDETVAHFLQEYLRANEDVLTAVIFLCDVQIGVKTRKWGA